MLQIMKTLFFSLLVCCVLAYPANSMDSEHLSISSTILLEDRGIIVHFPKGYDANKKGGYPVIYMLDAGNDDALTAKINAEQFIKGTMPEAIIVAITSIRRGFDFTAPYEKFGRTTPKTAGNADKFLSFIKQELIPRVTQRFNTSNERVLIGHSWGAAFTAYALSQDPALFNGYILFTPTFLYRETLDQSTVKLYADIVENFKKIPNMPRFIYTSVGQIERDRFKNSGLHFGRFLKDNAPNNIKTHNSVTAGADHMSNPKLDMKNALMLYFEKTN